MIQIPEGLLDSITQEVILPKIEESQTTADLNNNMSISLREFLQENVQNIFNNKNLDRNIKLFIPTLLEDLAYFEPRLRNQIGKDKRWTVSWKIWSMIGPITDKLLHFSYYSQWENIRNRVILASLKDCSNYFAQYFELLRVKEETQTKKNIIEIYDYLIIIIKKLSNDEEIVQSLEKKRDSIYRSWLSSCEALFRLKKQLQFSQGRSNFQIPRLPQSVPFKTQENMELEHDIATDNKKYTRVFYDLDFEDYNYQEVDIIVKIGSAVKSFINDLQTGSLERNARDSASDQLQFNSFVIRIALEKYKLLYRSFSTTCERFHKKFVTNSQEKDQLKRFLKQVKITEEFMMECLQKYCEELVIHQKVFAMHIADVASEALFLYQPKGYKGIVKNLLF